MPDAALHLRYVLGLLDLLPPGRALTRQPGSSVYQVAEGLALELARVHERTDDALREMIPWQSVEMLPDWEELLGITSPAALLEERQATVLARLQGDGPPTRPGFDAIAASLGYTLTWLRDEPFVCGVARVGMRVGGERRIFTWQPTYQVGGSNDALLEELLVTYGGGHGGGQLTPAPYDSEATFRSGAFAPFFGLDWTSWANAGDISPLPGGLLGVVPKGFINALDALDFDGSATFATADDWQDYVSASAKYVAFVVEVDAAGALDLIVSGSLSWGVFLEDDGSGPVLTGWSYDGGAGVYTPEIPIVLGTTYVVELLHVDGVMTLRVYDGTIFQTESVAAPPSDVVAGVLALSPLSAFDGRVAGLVTYGARGAVPGRAERVALSASLAALYIP